MKLLTKDAFIIQASAKHNNRYDYSNINFPIKLTEKLTLMDPEYGEFTVNANRHLAGQGHKQYGHKKTGDKLRLTVEEFIKKANQIHNNYYDYSYAEYKGMNIKVKIVDPTYGEFWQTPAGHLSGQGHPLMGVEKAASKRRRDLSEFIKLSKDKHGGLYDYSKVIYENCDKKVCIIDPEYGEFWQTPYQHLNSHGCPKRTKNKKWTIHYDHIIPLSIIRTSNKGSNEWYKNRPLYKFLNSDINLVPVEAKFNIDKNELVSINGKIIPASSIRNNYDIISFLIRKEFNIDPTQVINNDRDYILQYFKL